jgi:thioredoxin reductase (NADPH)
MNKSISPPEQYDAIIIGGGPIGLELAIAFARLNHNYLLLEGEQIGHAFSLWPPNTHFFSTPEHVALAGVPVHNQDQRPISGEEYLAYLRTLVEMFDLRVRPYQPVSHIERNDDGFTVTAVWRGQPRQYQARRVILATGGMAGPRRLNIPGEDLPHVSHYFPGPHPYFRTRLLVVGGRNSALEAALRCWRGGADVTVSYRRPNFDFDRVKPHLSMDISDRLEKGEIRFLPATVPVAITPERVTLAATDAAFQPDPALGLTALSPDFVLLCTGFTADMSLFQRAGVELRGEGQAVQYNPETMETNVPGLYVAGTAAGGTQSKFTYFISTCHHHVDKISRAILGQPAGPLGTVTNRNNAVTWEEVKAN